MRVFGAFAGPLVAATLLAGCGGGSQTPLPASAASSLARNAAPAASLAGESDFARELASGLIRPVCNHNVSPGQAVCLSYVLTDPSVAPRASGVANVSGYGPADLQSAYNLGKSINNAGGTVALVLWYNDPNLDADLAVYRKTFGLPPCRKSTKCLQQVDEHGGSNLPQNDTGAAVEESLDVDMVSANCPKCKIVYVEAAQPTSADLQIAENTAAKLAGVVAISNSWDTPGQEITTKSFENAFSHAGQAVVASAGDAGYSVSSPADYNTLTAAVGTHLTKGGGGRGWTESVWNGTGSGCSAVVAAQSWQTQIEKMDNLKGCAKRVVGDVAYVADPATGVAVYDTYGAPGFFVVGGTSVSAPAEAAIYALAGKQPGIPASLAYANLSSFNDVTTGSNGSCSPTWLCTARKGYDAPSGVGSPNGIGGF